MPEMMDIVDMPDAVAAAFDAMPPEEKTRLLGVRARVFDVAEGAGAGPLTETLKWGEPAYLTEASKSGSTVRLGLSGARAAVFFNCQTGLVDGFRSDFPEAFEYVGNRAVILSDADDLAVLDLCLGRALTYHRDKRKAVT